MKKFLKNNIEELTSTVTAIISIGLSVFANMLYNWLVSYITKIENTNVEIASILLFVVIIILGTFVIYLTAKLLKFVSVCICPERSYDKYTQHAFIKNKALISKRQKNFQEAKYTKMDDKFLMNEACRNIDLAINSCYEFFESAFSKTGQLVDEINFEVTFMTISYIDNKITIPFSCNKEHRSPTSMLHREEDPDIFSNTETAKIYSIYQSGQKPIMKLIPDTVNEGKYKEIYNGQKDRIKSTIILPILSHKNELQGTLVVHCNKLNFFKNNRYSFWNEILEIFSVDIGYNILLLGKCISCNSKLAKPF